MRGSHTVATLATHGLSGSRMSGKERLEAALECEEVDRVPWAPKVFIGHYRSGTSAVHQRMSIAEFADVLHCDAIAWDNLIAARTDGVTHGTTKQGHTTTRLTQTPVGQLRQSWTWSPEAHTSHPTEFPLKGPGDYEVAKYIAEHTIYEPVSGRHQEMLRSVGDRGVVVTAAPGTPLMTLLQNTIGMPQAYYHITDYQRQFDELFEVEADGWSRYYDALATTDAEFVCTQENTSTTLISPALYRKYCLPLKKRARKLMHRAGKHYMLHMCGCLQDLLPDILEAGADSWESFTPPPIGDTLFQDGRAVAGDAVSLVGGINAAMLTMWPRRRLLDYVVETVESLPHAHGITFTSGGAMPVECPLDELADIGRDLTQLLSRWGQ